MQSLNLRKELTFPDGQIDPNYRKALLLKMIKNYTYFTRPKTVIDVK